MKDAACFPTLLEMFFTRRLIAQRKASPHTIASYRDTFRLLLQFAEKRLSKTPSKLTMEDLNAPFLGAFLDDLESTRANGARSRNLRLTSIRSFFRFAALEVPQHSGLIQRVLAIPNKRQPRPLVGFLTRPEIDALLAAPDRNTWVGCRDHTLFLNAVQTGLRLTEITSIRQQDISLATGAHVRCEGKGAQGTMYSANQNYRDRVNGVDPGTRLRRHTNPLSQCARRWPQRRRGSASRRKVRCSSTTNLPINVRQAYLAACSSPHHGDGVDASGCRSDPNSTLARTRIRRNDADLLGCQSRHQGGSPFQNHTDQRQGRPLSAGRCPVGLSQGPLTSLGLCRIS